MAKIEVTKFVGSSQDNFLVFSNANYEKPYVTFYFKHGQSPSGSITIKDALDDDGYSKTISYSPDDTISDSSFRCTTNREENTFAFLECLRKNVIFYDISLITDIPNVGIVIKAYIDSSTKYSITGGEILTIGGTFSSFIPKPPNKYTLLINSGNDQITLEKHTMAEEVSFNVTAPFEHLTFKDPLNVKMIAYHIDNSSIVVDNISNNNITVLPTTLSKFANVNLSKYYYNYFGQKVDFLTNNFHRSYNYGEACALSVLTDRSNLKLLKKYYTVSGKYLGSDNRVTYKENPYMRHDFYFYLDLDGIESSTNKQVGYVEVVALYEDDEITNPVRYDVVPKCNQNNEIMFVNELGGIDSFNFLGERSYKSQVDDQVTYFKNPTRHYGVTKELELVAQKKNKVTHTLKSSILDVDTARWLNELAKAKYVFLFTTSGARFERIVVTDMTIDLSDRENTFEIELSYQNGDTNIAI